MNLPLPISAAAIADLRTALVSLLAAFAMSHLLAIVYVWSHRGLSYAQSFIQTLVMSGVATAMMMLAIGNNIVWGIGVVGALALVRFRTNLRDPRDMVFIFAALVAGIACGTRAYALGTVGTIIFSLVALYLSHVPFGARKTFDGLLRFTIPWEGAGNSTATETLQRHCRQFVLATIREVGQGEASEHVYHVRFRRDDSRLKLAQDLAAVPGLSGMELLLEDSRIEA
ncbi:MAG: DUF4956 domain-containing protein [Acidobacteria bacterium]|nr:DUF4956 domain-containing protein [Acidobacteriota bacterium]